MATSLTTVAESTITECITLLNEYLANKSSLKAKETRDASVTLSGQCTELDQVEVP